MLGTCVAHMRRFLQIQPPVGTPQKILAVVKSGSRAIGIVVTVTNNGSRPARDRPYQSMKQLYQSAVQEEVSGMAVNSLEEIYRESTEALEESRKLYSLGGKLQESAKGKVGDQELNALLNDINRGCFIGKKIKNMVGSINDYIKIDALLFELHEHVYDSCL
jgi:hypothetical protein